MRNKQYLLKPVVTEKSTKLSELGKYTFVVSPELTKNQVRSLLNELYGVKIGKVCSDLFRVKTKRTFKGGKWIRAKYQRSQKKVIIELTGSKDKDKDKDKIAKLFKL